MLCIEFKLKPEMNLNIYIEDHLARQLSAQAEKLHRKKNSIIREALAEWLKKYNSKSWPSSVIEFQGIEDWDDISSLRKGLPDRKKNLF